MADIFLSYTEKDRDKARRLATMLESVGWTVWWDRRIPAGKTWRSVLQQALHETRCMVVLWSARSIESEWVCEEASEGRRLNKLVPVLIEAVRPPAGFREIQAADLTGWSGSAEHDGMRMLIADLEKLLGPPGTPARMGPQPVHSDPVAAERVTTLDRPYDPADLAMASETSGSGKPRAWLPWAVAGALVVAMTAAWVGRSSSTSEQERVRDRISPSQGSGLPQTRAETPRVPTAPTTEVRPIEPAPQPKPQPAPQAELKKSEPSTRVTPRTADEGKRAEPRPRNPARCGALLEKIQLGEPLSDEAMATYKKECSP